jgi:hypothetical protein
MLDIPYNDNIDQYALINELSALQLEQLQC